MCCLFVGRSDEEPKPTTDKVKAEAPGDPSTLTVAANLGPAPGFEVGNLRSLTPFQLDAKYT
jgi:hypothetical protein